MFVKQVKRKCGVRGCKSTECFAVSRTREVGNTVIICKSCLGKALGAIDEIDSKTKSNIPIADSTAAPPLFFNAKALGATETKTYDATVVTLENGQESTTFSERSNERESEQLDGVDPADEANDADGTNSTKDETGFKCPVCGKLFDSEKGLKMHLRYCQPQTDNE